MLAAFTAPGASAFPPIPHGVKGRTSELRTLARTIADTRPTRLALVGSGGSGKSVLATALGHRLKRVFEGRIYWFRVGAWDFHTLAEMLALGLGTSMERARLVPELRACLKKQQHLLVLDNHENDAALSRLLTALGGTEATFVITARRCLVSGVLVYPVTAPLVTTARDAFPRVGPLTRLLRWNPLALDIADALVASGATSVSELQSYLQRKRVDAVRVIAHEDDLPEVALLVAWCWQRLSPASRRMLGVLSHIEGDHMDLESLACLAKADRTATEALAPLQRWHLIQEPIASRYAVHAVVRYAVARRTEFSHAEAFEYYVSLLEQRPERLPLEQTHLFAAVDHAHRTSDLQAMLRVQRVLQQLGYGGR